ncbi:MAG: Fic family protein [Candidatus Eremiobacteraeota bacterium]|nr:Fic family protein [Candidatus Eremiobacteraeota bacterium]
MRNFLLEELADALDDRSGQFRYFFVASTGRVQPYAAEDPAAHRVAARADAISILPLSHAEALAIQSDFVETLLDGELADRLRASSLGPAAQGRFLQVLSAYPRARRSWLSFRQRRLEASALDWLREHGIDLGKLGLDQPARSEEEATGLRFDAALEQRLRQLRDRLRSFSARGEAAALARTQLRGDFRVDEIYHSNAIRGNRLTREQTEDLLTRGDCVGGLSLREHLEVVNLMKALERSAVLAASDAPLTEHAIRELHAQLFASIDDEQAGEYRRTDARIVGRDYLPPESVLVPALLREFTEWLDESTADPVAKAAAAQAKILNIAPFLDGNGRVGRLLSNLILEANGYPPAIVHVEDRERYYDGLRQADGGDMSGLLALLIDRIENALARLEGAVRSPHNV